MKIAYNNWNPNKETYSIVVMAEEIIDEYETAGYVLTLRQLYYQFVARDIIENSERSYKRLGNIVNNARLAGLISWESIEDRNRSHNNYWYDENELNPLRDLPSYIRFDRWARQDYYVEVWVEKEALGNVVEKACNPYLVPHLACKGYLSASEAWRAGRRFKEKSEQGKNCILIHLGDHDPSGIDMTRDNEDRVRLFSETNDIEVHRIALNMNQVDHYSPPPNPTKLSDSRAKDYIKKFGNTSWELDALEPSVIRDLITEEITKYIDTDLWIKVGQEEAKKKQLLEAVYDNWDNIKLSL